MKKLIFLALTALMMVGCNNNDKPLGYTYLELDSCEYISGLNQLAHKGNCRFCEERDSIKWEKCKKRIEGEITMAKEEKLKAWVARDKFDDGLSIYSVAKPKRERGYWGNDGNKGASRMFINKELFPELRWEDEPIEVELIIRTVK